MPGKSVYKRGMSMNGRRHPWKLNKSLTDKQRNNQENAPNKWVDAGMEKTEKCSYLREHGSGDPLPDYAEAHYRTLFELLSPFAR